MQLAPLRTRLLSLITAFVDGLKTIVRAPERLRLVWTTALMWLTYGLMAYIPILMFDLHSSVSLSYWDGLAIMFIGVLGMVVPTPGGAGTFHYITVLTLTAVYGITTVRRSGLCRFCSWCAVIPLPHKSEHWFSSGSPPGQAPHSHKVP